MKLVILQPEGIDVGKRLDEYLSGSLEGCSRSYMQKMIAAGAVSVDEPGPVKNSRRITGTETIRLELPDPEPLEAQPQNIPLDIVYEDEDLLVVNKPKGMVVHPAAGHPDGTLVNALLYHCAGKLSGINGILRPGIVHRIDRDTTGLLMVAKTDFAHQSLAEQLKEHRSVRRYTALAGGRFAEEEGTVDRPIGRDRSNPLRFAVDPDGKNAVTHWKVREHFEKAALIECRLETGRTHQIRVHMASLGHPLLGDELYGGQKIKGVEGQCLHAGVLGFTHPRTGEYMEFTAPLPAYMEDLCRKLRG